MEVQVLAHDGKNLKFVLSGTTPAFANAVRRAVMLEVPTMAVDEVDFIVNDSIMNDEILAHRLALIPLRTPDGYLLPEECTCEDKRCPKCSVTLTLKKRGPALIVSGDLESSDEEVVPVSDSIPIVRLGEGQRLELVAIARLGRGKDHAKWQPGVISYKYMPTIDVDERLCNACGECVEACPRGLLKLSGEHLVVEDLERCNMCKNCVEACPKGAIEVGYDPTKFIFRVESSGAMPPEKIIEKGGS